MNNYEYIKNADIEQMAMIITGLETKMYEEIRKQFKLDIPPLTDKSYCELLISNSLMLNEEREQENEVG